MNKCAKCEAVFSKWSDYHTHTTRVNCAKAIKPINTTGRTKEQIVSDFEIKNQHFILPYDGETIQNNHKSIDELVQSIYDSTESMKGQNQ